MVGDLNRRIDKKIEKFATFSKEYYEELGKSSNPIDFASDEFKNRERFDNDAACKVMTFEEEA